MTPRETNGIVADGQERARAAAMERVRAEVQRRFAPELARAGFWRRWALRLHLRREIQRRMEQIAPRDALYGRRTE